MATSSTPPRRTISDYVADAKPLAEALSRLAREDQRGVLCGDRKIPWGVVTKQAHTRAEWFLAQNQVQSANSAYPQPRHVGLLLANGPEYVAWLCAAAISPLVAVGLNDTRTAASLATDIKTADCAVVLYDDAHRDLAAALATHADIPVLPVDAATVATDSARTAEPDPTDRAFGDYAAQPDDLVALVFTSGTSGDPKAVRVTHRKIAAPAQMIADRFGIDATDCIYNAMPMFHSNAVLVAWPLALLTGADLALRPKFSASGWLPDVRRFGATFANYVGAPLSYILATPESDDDADNPMRVVYGNEAPPKVREEFARRFGVRVVDGFGSTEGGVAVSRTPDTPPAALGPLPAGALVVAPGTDDPCPPGRVSASGELLNPDEAIGELVAEGPGLFAGYYNDAAADDARMRGGRYRSGDLVFVDATGYVHFVGRASTWMRVGGENLAATPIERVLARHPDLAEVAVYGVPCPDGPGDEVAAACVLAASADDGARLDVFEAGLHDFLAAQPDLSPRQWPRYVRITDKLPRTASFKIRARDLTARGTVAGPDVLLERQGRAPAQYSR